LTESVERAYSQEEAADDIIAEAEKGIVAVTEGRTRLDFVKYLKSLILTTMKSSVYQN
jgi:replicative DNA helicase